MTRAVAALRNKIRDKAVLNRLLMGQYESTDPELQQALIEALIDWNVTPPLIPPVTLETHPRQDLLLDCAAAKALTSAGVWHSREHMPSSDGGTSADDHAKAAEYSAWAERLLSPYEDSKVKTKVAINIAAAINHMGVPSEYSFLFGGTPGRLF